MDQQHLENLNLQLKLAKKINGEIINADSMQVYKELKFYQQDLLKKIIKKLNIIYMDFKV
jgi:tRNA A37 N6-isopentenylltransferase MiaA